MEQNDKPAFYRLYLLIKRMCLQKSNIEWQTSKYQNR